MLSRHILDEFKQFFVLRNLRVSRKFENQTLVGCDLGSSISHSFYSNCPVMETHRTYGINYKGYTVIPLKQVEACLFDAHMRLNSIKNYFLPIRKSLNSLPDRLFKHREVGFFKSECVVCIALIDIVNFLHRWPKNLR